MFVISGRYSRMDDLNLLSNEELKYRLTQFGFANLPVTNTTRKVLIKKLKNHMENEKSKLRRDTSYATRYSSDEDFSQSDKEPTTKKRFPRSTIGIPSHNRPFRTDINTKGMPPPSPSLPISSKRKTWGSSSQPTSPPKSSVYISPLIQSGSSDSDEESDTNLSNIGLTSFSSRYSNSSGEGLSPRTTSSFYNDTNNGGLSDVSNVNIDRYAAYGVGMNSRLFGSGKDEADSSTPHNTSDSSARSTNGIHNGNDADPNDFTKRLLSFRNRNSGSNPTAPPFNSGSISPQLNSGKTKIS